MKAIYFEKLNVIEDDCGNSFQSVSKTLLGVMPENLAKQYENIASVYRSEYTDELDGIRITVEDIPDDLPTPRQIKEAMKKAASGLETWEYGKSKQVDAFYNALKNSK